MKKGFTLLELLVVIGIIGILSGIMLVSFGGSTEKARAAKCMSNMRSLAVAAQSYGMAHDYYPSAGTFEYTHMGRVKGMKKIGVVYRELYGWPCRGFSFAVSGIMIPPTVFSSAGFGSTSTLSANG